MSVSKSLSDVKVLLEFLQTDESREPNHEAQITSLQTLCGMCSDKGEFYSHTPESRKELVLIRNMGVMKLVCVVR